MNALCIMTSLLDGLCCQVKASQSAQPEKPEVPTTGEPRRCSLRVLAAVLDYDRTKEAMVDDIHSFFSPFPFSQSRPIKVLPPSCKSLGT